MRQRIETRKPIRTSFKSLRRTIEKVRKTKAIIFALGSKRCIGESSDAYVSISGYSIIFFFAFI
jgi:hypothetical protein